MSTLGDHLYEIATGARALPVSTARRHHYVPQFLLRNFTLAAAHGEPKLQLLDKATGAIEPVTTRGTAWESHLYSYHDDDGQRSNRLEAFLSVVEDHAAQALGRFLDDPFALAEEDRETLSIYLALQESRTPAALAEKREFLRQAGTILSALELANARGKQQAKLLEAHEALLDGRIVIEPTDAGTLSTMLEALAEVAQVIANLPWLLLRAAEGEFILSDRPLTRREPLPRHPFSAGAWLSSPFVFTTLPLSPAHCLRIGPVTREPIIVREVKRQVTTTNLRTYGWGTRYILGRSADVLAEVHEHALRTPEGVSRPVPQRLVMLESMDTADPTQAEANRARGWNPYIYHREDDGSLEQLSYRVIETVDDARAEMAPRRHRGEA